jgi:DNA-binding transcriptional MerR regulator
LTTVTPDTEAQLTVEQLAHQSGMSVRNIRNHQSRGLLPPPEVRARKGYYGSRHLERLRVIQQMQAEGFKLSAIERLIGEHGTTADRFVGLRRLVTAPEEVESPEVLTAAELAERFGEVDPKVVARAEKMGLLVALGDGRYEATSPALIKAAEEVTARGVPLAEALTVIERVRRNSQSTARAFVKLFLDEVWQPFDDAGRPEERWEEITQSIEDLRPLASDAVVAMFRQVLADEMEDAFGKVLRSHSARRGKNDGD